MNGYCLGAHKLIPALQIRLEVGKAMATLDALLLDRHQASFDIAFVGKISCLHVLP